MIPPLSEICKIVLFKHGVSGREILPTRLKNQWDILDTETRLNISGNYYEDFHVYGSSAIEIDINWWPGTWIIQMRRRNERREIEVSAGRTSRLASEWRNLFLFTGEMPFPAQEDIVISDFDIYPDRRSVVFSGQFFNHYSGVKGCRISISGGTASSIRQILSASSDKNVRVLVIVFLPIVMFGYLLQHLNKQSRAWGTIPSRYMC